MRRHIVGGNWKMNLNRASGPQLAREVTRMMADAISALPTADRPEVVIFPPFPYLLPVAEVLAEHADLVALGAQNVYVEAKGAFTGEVSPEMLRDCGCTWVLAGHSERRHILLEQDGLINRKVHAALNSGLSVVLCVGETLEQRRAGETNDVTARQVRAGLKDVGNAHVPSLVIAYEPVWAIGTGNNATPRDAQAAHAHIRSVLSDQFGAAAADSIRIQYGGSVTPANAESIMAEPDVDGALVGGASLTAAVFLDIVRATGRVRT